MSKRLTKEEFTNSSKRIHGDKYNYSLVEYVNNRINVEIICPIHGIFKQSPDSHLRGRACKKCSDNKLLSNVEELVIKFNNIHNNKYDYSLIDYNNMKKKIKIKCKKHGIFEQTPINHLKSGCPICSYEKKTYDNKIIKKMFINIHNNKYIYNLVKYKGTENKVKIICKKHGIFEQTPHSHLQGQGCPLCNESKGEKEIKEILKENNIIFIPQKRFNDCKYKRKLPFDFYLPEHNICVEYDGRQHFEPVKDFGGKEQLKKTQKNDKIKDKYCNNNNIKLLRIKYTENIQEKLSFLTKK